jgi:hypothetical protein
VEAVLAAIEALPPAEALRRSFVAYPLVNALHILAVGMLLTGVLIMHWALLVPGRSMPSDLAERLMRPMALSAFVVAVVTGLALFSVRAGDYVSNPAFQIKGVVIVLAILNFFAMLVVRYRSTVLRRAAAVLSAVLWLSALIAGRFIGFVE